MNTKIIITAAAVCLAAAASAQFVPAPAGEPVPLPDYVVTATRTPQEPRHLPSSVTLLAPDDWARTQTTSLAELLRTVPGLAVVSSGAPGAQSAVFFRGSASHQTLFLVDGVRINDRNTLYQNALGGADLANVGRVEVLRGPQSVLYGGSAMGGVVALETRAGSGAPSGRLHAEAGSFGTLAGGADAAGSSGPLDWSASAGWLETDNERPGNRLEQLSWSARADWRVADGLVLGATVRALDSTYEEPGARGPFPFSGVVDLRQTLATAFAEHGAGTALRSRLTLAGQERDYTFASMFGATPARHTRRVAEWQSTADLPGGVELTGGFSHEEIRQRVAGVRQDERLAAGFLSAVWRPEPSPDTTFIAGLRHDDYRSVGGHDTGRVGVAHVFDRTGTKLRATFGTAFTAPSLDDRYGNAAYFQPASPGVRPERSRGWDAGVEQSLAGGRGLVAATIFANRYRNLFSFDPFTYATINIGRARSRGAELEAAARPADGLLLRVGYTWTDAEDATTGAPLARRPRHVASAAADWQPAVGWLLGIGLSHQAGRVDTGAVALEDYTVVRAHASWRATPRVRLHARAENLFDADYEEVAGYPARGFGVFGGVEVSF